MGRRPRDIGTACSVCNAPLPVLDGRSARRKTCSAECKNARRRQNYTPKQPAPRPSLAERLWARVERQPSGCWEWQGYRQSTGHGQIGRGGRRSGNVMAHRAAWEVTHGPIPEGLVVRHRCDNPPCCNPEHLELGTQELNVQDMVIRDRQARGSRLPQTKLTDEQIATIRARVAGGELQRVVAAAYGVTQGYVSTVVVGDYRKDVA